MENQVNAGMGQAPMTTPKKGNPLVWIIILVVLLVAGYFLMQKKPKADNDPGQAQNQMKMEANSSEQIQAEIQDVQFEGVSESI